MTRLAVAAASELSSIERSLFVFEAQDNESNDQAS